MIKKKYFEITSLVKGIRVLELLAGTRSLGVSEVARLLGMNRASSHRFLSTLREIGYVERQSDGKYRLSLKVLEVGMKALNRFEIRKAAQPYMQELSLCSKETINLGFWDGLEVIHLEKIHSREVLRMDSAIGTKAPAYCTALGKAILANLPGEEISAYLDSIEMTKLAPNTITNKNQLLKELNITRTRCYSIDNEELAIGLRCIAGAVFDHTGYPAYAMSVAGPTVRLTLEKIDELKNAVLSACRKLSEYLGNREAIKN